MQCYLLRYLSTLSRLVTPCLEIFIILNSAMQHLWYHPPKLTALTNEILTSRLNSLMTFQYYFHVLAFQKGLQKLQQQHYIFLKNLMNFAFCLSSSKILPLLFVSSLRGRMSFISVKKTRMENKLSYPFHGLEVSYKCSS